MSDIVTPLAIGTTWNPADVSNVTLSGGNLTATASAQGGVRSIYSTASGKYYWEYTLGSAPTQILLGIGNSATILSSVAGTLANCAIVAGTGGIYCNNFTQAANVGSMTSSLLCGVALDVGAKLIWFRNGPTGFWNSTSPGNDPAAGTGGVNITPIASGALYGLFAPAAACSATANFGDSAFAGVVPSGYAAGFPGAAAGGSAMARVMVMA